MGTHLASISSFFFICLWVSTASAGTAVWLEGPASAAVEDRLRARVPSLTESTSGNFRSRSVSEGVPKSLANVVDDLAYSPAVDGLRNAARALGAEAVFVGVTRKNGPRLQLRWVILETESGNTLGQGAQAVRSKKRRRVKWQTGNLERKIGRALAMAAPLNESTPAGSGNESPPASKPDFGSSSRDQGNEYLTAYVEERGESPFALSESTTTIETTATTPRSRSSRNRNRLADRALDIGAAYTVGGRDFAYQGSTNDELLSYTGLGAQGVCARLRAFPGAFVDTDGFLPILGVVGDYQEFFGLKSRMDGGEKTAGTTWRAWSAGVASRFDLDPLVLLVYAVYSQTTFTFGKLDDAPTQAVIPRVRYQQIRAGLETAFDLDPFSLGLSASYGFLLNKNTMDGVFYQRSGHGFDFELGVSYNIVAGLDAQLGVRYGLVLLGLTSTEKRQVDATGVMDHFFSATAGLAYHL